MGAPAQQPLSLLGDEPIEHVLAVGPLDGIGRQEDVAYAVEPCLGQIDA
jgi:hypothetical protein